MKVDKVSVTLGQYNGLKGNIYVKKENAVQKQDKQINQLSNVCYKPLSFGRSKAEHKSWGGVINPETKDVSFKLLTYPDTKKVIVTVEKRNNPEKKQVFTLKNNGNGIFTTPEKIPSELVSDGDRYFYTIYKGNGDVDIVKDPYSNRQESLLGASTLYDHSKYNWSDDDWFNNNKKRISRKADGQNGLTPVSDARIYELNIATFTKKGTFDAAKAKLNSLKELGFNAIEIMPVENTYSFNWGYDGVDKMAPSEHLGGPDGLKNLINYAHNIGLNVIIDMVPNHIGPDGAALLKTGPYISGNNCFGEALNYEGKNSRYVRDFIVNAALNWIENYHCDGLRLDMTKFMSSDYTMKQIAAEVNYHNPDAFLIAEDSRSGVGVREDGSFYDDYFEPHDNRVVNSLKSFESGENQSESVHCQAINNISDGNTSLGRLGYDSEWDFFFYHRLKEGLYGNINLDEFEKACMHSQDTVKYVMSHDEIGNYEGSRLIAKLMVPMLNLNDNVVLNDEDKNRAEKLSKLKNSSLDDALNTVSLQKAQFVAEKLAIMLQSGKLDKYNTEGITSRQWIHAIDKAFRDEVLSPLGIKQNSGITYDIVKTMYNKSFNKNKMALARIYSIPGPKMVFQGDEASDLTPFRFFRQFESVKNEENLHVEKGYDTGRKALIESTLGNITYSSSGKNLMSKFRHLTRDLNILNKQNPSLSKGEIVESDTIKHYASSVLATHNRDYESGNETYTITNFIDADYPRKDAAEYYITFPEGQWIEVLNTDNKKYGGSGNINTSVINSDGHTNYPIKMSGFSNLIFKRIN